MPTGIGYGPEDDKRRRLQQMLSNFAAMQQSRGVDPLQGFGGGIAGVASNLDLQGFDPNMSPDSVDSQSLSLPGLKGITGDALGRASFDSPESREKFAEDRSSDRKKDKSKLDFLKQIAGIFGSFAQGFSQGG